MIMNSEHRLFASFFLLLVTMLTACTQKNSDTEEKSADGNEESIRYIEPNAATGTSMGTVVSGKLPLAHTGQFLAFDKDGKLVGSDNTGQQIQQVLKNVRLALTEVGAGLENLVKLNVYVASNEVAEQVRTYFAETFTGEAKPAVSFVVTKLPRQKALVAMDAVAAGVEARDQSEVLHADSLYGDPNRGHVAILPVGERVYLSGQVDPGDLLTATRGTMESLHGTLAYLGLSAEDVAQVKAYLPDASRVDEVEKVIAEYYREKPVPPVVFVEWSEGDYLRYLSTDGEKATPIEISLITSGQASTEDITYARDSPNYLTYPGLTDYPGYSRIVTVPQADLVYTSGLYGGPSRDAAGQVQDIFRKMKDILKKAGSDFDHLVKGTYYVTGEESSDKLGDIRKDLFNPDRFPASDKMPVRGVGKKEATISIDMVGMVPK